MRSPLDGIKVLDLTIWQNGPWGTVMLSDMGAQVIKIEDPVNGDPGRGFAGLGGVVAGQTPTLSSYFQTMNRNKQSMTLNLKTEEARRIFYKMVKTADVVTQNFRVGVVEKLGVDYETVRKINPKIIYGSVSGLGPKGPDAQEGVFDILGQARGGFMSLLAASVGYPIHAAQGMSDQTGAIMLAHGILLAIIARERFGVGQHVQTSQLGSQLTLQAMTLNAYLLTDEMPRPRFIDRAANPLFNLYKCGDEKWIALGCVQGDRYWGDICVVLNIEHFLDDPRFNSMDGRRDNNVELIALLNDVFSIKGRDEWVLMLRERGVLCSPVQNYDDLLEDPQVVANEYFTELEHPVFGTMKEVGVTAQLSETPGAARSPAPEFGEHTEQVLLTYGYSWEDIAGFRERNVI